MPRFYLSSLDSFALETVRICDFVALKRFDSAKTCVVAEVTPPIPGGPFDLPFDLTEVVLAARHEGDDLADIREFPCFVHVARALVCDLRTKADVLASDVENLAWGELYRSRNDAEHHLFDRLK